MEEARGLWYWARTFLEQLVAMILANIFVFFWREKERSKVPDFNGNSKVKQRPDEKRTFIDLSGTRLEIVGNWNGKKVENY
jgi:hypothetical protein